MIQKNMKMKMSVSRLELNNFTLDLLKPKMADLPTRIYFCFNNNVKNKKMKMSVSRLELNNFPPCNIMDFIVILDLLKPKMADLPTRIYFCFNMHQTITEAYHPLLCSPSCHIFRRQLQGIEVNSHGTENRKVKRSVSLTVFTFFHQRIC